LRAIGSVVVVDFRNSGSSYMVTPRENVHLVFGAALPSRIAPNGFFVNLIANQPPINRVHLMKRISGEIVVQPRY